MQKNSRFYLKTILGVLLVSLIAGYSYYQSRNILGGPQITIESPANGETVSSKTLAITGQAKNVSAITLDDGAIFINEAGKFNETRLLLPGYNAIKVRVEDKFGRNAEKIIEVVYKPAV